MTILALSFAGSSGSYICPQDSPTWQLPFSHSVQAVIWWCPELTGFGSSTLAEGLLGSAGQAHFSVKICFNHGSEEHAMVDQLHYEENILASRKQIILNSKFCTYVAIIFKNMALCLIIILPNPSSTLFFLVMTTNQLLLLMILSAYQNDQVNFYNTKFTINFYYLLITLNS